MRKLKLEELGRVSLEEFKQQSKAPVVVILDNVRSMHNVGAVLRSSDAFGVEKVWMCGITPTPPHREIRKTAIGAEESVDWEKHPDASQLCLQLQKEGYKILAIEQTDESLDLADYKPNPTDKYALVLGHEVHGVSEGVINACDQALEIPQFGTKHSLNISVAAGIVLYKVIVEGQLTN
ncbi:MAG: RNA methyltransferase [Bacteroidia bacterium]|nr:RNA methyltransferase [Bacteroidia bacterium]